MTPVVVLHVPHSSSTIPTDLEVEFLVSKSDFAKELLYMTDWFTDELFFVPEADAATVKHDISRLIVDPERFPDDADEPMSKKGMGAVYTRTSDGRTLKRVSRKERDGLMQRYYWPHQHELERCVGLALDAHGKCLIIDCHSFASIRLPYEDEDHAPRPEICLGTDPFHTPPWLLDRARHAISAVAWELAVNRPFSGSIVPKEYFRADRRVWSIMIEVRRDLYMDEASGEKRPEFRSSLGRVIRALTEEATYRENSP